MWQQIYKQFYILNILATVSTNIIAKISSQKASIRNVLYSKQN